MNTEYQKSLLSLVLTVGVLFLAAQPAVGQEAGEIRKMSLQEVLTITQNDNFRIRMAESDVNKVRSQYRQTNATFLPQILLEETGTYTNDPLNVFGLKLKQEVVTQADFNPALLNAPDPYENFTTKLSVQQPLINSDMLFKRSAVRDQLEAARKQLQGTIEHARFQVKDTYYRLMLMQNRLSVIEKSLTMAKENRRQAANYYEQNMISKADYLAAKVRVLELESKQSRTSNQLQNVQDNLRYLLGIKEEVTILPTDSLEVKPVSTENIDPQQVTNSKLQALQYRLSSARQMLRSSKFNFVPSLNLFGSYEFNDDNLFGTQGESFMVGATLKWNLFSGFSKVGKVMESRADLKKAELAYESQRFKNEMEVKQARRSLQQAQKQLNFAKSSVEQAREDFRIRKNRYNQGLEKTTDLLAAETKLAQTRAQRLNAMYQYNLSIATLELLLEQEIAY
ncbi:TolC family protein [Fodinibius saliphilus]|uniref:TolC family protein n=1 Tax=Fodinibius saliphilus TaxID=1920650 RepID=UPI00110908C0|nr:TolC family protein [Fodinibius saliphilus]